MIDFVTVSKETFPFRLMSMFSVDGKWYPIFITEIFKNNLRIIWNSGIDSVIQYNDRPLFHSFHEFPWVFVRVKSNKFSIKNVNSTAVRQHFDKIFYYNKICLEDMIKAATHHVKKTSLPTVLFGWTFSEQNIFFFFDTKIASSPSKNVRNEKVTPIYKT